MSSTIPPVLVQLVADVTQLKAGLVQAQNSLKNLDGSVQQSGAAMTNFMDKIKQVGGAMGIAFGGAAVLNFLRSSVTEANAASAAQERLRQLLITTGGATNEYVDYLLDQASALEKVGVVSKANIVTAQSQLATFDLAGETIATLTPAILDYVTAEKGAAATSDDFRQMTNGLAQALNGNFGSLTRVGFVLDDQTKKLISSGTESERAAAIVKVLNSTYKDFNASLRDTNPMQVAMNELGNLKEDLGAALLPALEKVSTFVSDTFIPALRKLGKFIADNKDVILTFAAALTTAYVAMKIYRGMVILTTAAQKLYQVSTVLMRGGQLASIASTNGLAASMLKLNAVMRANPIGVIVTALALVAAGFVIAWKRSETFRNVVITVAQAALKAFAAIVPMIGKIAEAVLKVITGPLRGFLEVLSKLPKIGKYAQAGLDFINKGLDGVSDFADGASKKATELSNGLEKLRKTATKASEEVKKATTAPKGGAAKDTGGTGLTDAQKNKLEDYKKDVLDIYKNMNDAILDANEDAAKELIQRDEKIAAARLRFDDIMADAQQDRDRSEAAARKRNTEVLLEIEKDYIKKATDLEKTKNKQILDLQEAAAKKRNELTKSAAEKERSIVQTSIDRLRDAFASKTSFSLEDTFGSGRSVKSVLTTLKKNLTAAKGLQENAGTLAGMGYNQTFIEEIVKQGPRIGNNIAKSLKNATPEATAELQKLLSDVENVSANGLNKLATTMNSGGKLATQELMTAYSQVAIDLKNSLAEVDTELNKSLADANAAYSDALSEAQATRTEKMAATMTDLQEALAAAKLRFDDTLAEATVNLQRSLADAQKDYEKAIDEINKSTQKKLLNLKDKLADVAAAMLELKQSQLAFTTMQNAPVFTPITSLPIISNTGSVADFRKGEEALMPKYEITQNFTTTSVNPADVYDAVTGAVKYGNAITVPSAHRTR